MNARIVVDIAMAEGAIVRLLGLVERRGFRLRGVTMAEQDDGGTASVTMDVESRDAGRRLETLDLQLRRLIDVRNVSYSSTQAAGAL